MVRWESQRLTAAVNQGGRGCFQVLACSHMALATVILVVALIVLRLFLAPVPGLLTTGVNRWGKRTTIVLCATALAGAVVLIFISKR